MQCENFEQRLHDLLDERRRPELDAALLEHANECGPCRTTLRGQDALFDGLDTTRSTPPADLARRVVDAALESSDGAASERKVVETADRGARSWRMSRRQMLALAVAASLLVAMIPLFKSFFDGSGVTTALSPDAAADEPTTDTQGSGSNNHAAVDPSRVVAQDVARGFGKTVAYGVNGVLGMAGVGEGEFTVVYEIQWDSPALTQVADGLRPLAPLKNSVTAAVDALRKTIPRISEPDNSRSSYCPPSNLVSQIG